MRPRVKLCQQIQDAVLDVELMLNNVVCEEESSPQHDKADRRRVFLLAYMTRIRSTLKGMHVLCSADVHEPILVLYRTLFELWAYAVYLALGGGEALRRLEEQLESETQRMNNAFGRAGNVDQPTGRMTFRELMSLLRPLLAEADPDLRSNWLDDAYNSQYRTTSFHYVHGHLGGVSLHVDPSGNVVKEPDQDPSHHVLVVGAALCCSLLVAASLSMGFAEPGELVSSRTVLEHLQRKVLKQVKKGGQS